MQFPDARQLYHGIGKTKVVKALSAGIELNHLGDPKASSDRPCSSQRCSCSYVQVACSLFCKCDGRSTCCNPKTVSLVQETEHDLDTDSDTNSGKSDTDVSVSDDC